MAKRVSTDEKLSKIINFFKTTQDIYCIKDLEKKIPKECGVSAMLVPDLLKKLVDDNLISLEKCGSSNIFWCFPYQKHHYYRCELEKAQLAIESFKEENEKKRVQLEKMKAVEEKSPERTELIDEYNKLKEKFNKIEDQRKQSTECSIEEYKNLEKEKEEMKMKINKLTDNIFTIQGHMMSHYNIGRRDFNQSFGVADEMDYLN